jgi:hypothetical protein
MRAKILLTVPLKFEWKKISYIVSVLERALHARVHVVMVECHEHGVHHDAERDEQVHERVEHDEGKKFCQSEQSSQNSGQRKSKRCSAV